MTHATTGSSGGQTAVFPSVMIGVICQTGQEPFVAEFFELFKVPWEFYVEGNAYDVIIVAGPTDKAVDAPLTVAFGPGRQPWDRDRATHVMPGPDGLLLQWGDRQVPIYQAAVKLDAVEKPLLTTPDRGAIFGTDGGAGRRRLLRLGYDLFEEVRFLLTKGQPETRARIPALDIHADMLRSWIIESAGPLLEVPPRPGPHRFAVCLTHDVDFINLRDHGVGRSLLGFVARALRSTHRRDTSGRVVWSRIVRNWKAVLSLPAVYLGLCRDTWFDIDRYMDLERDLGPTFFFIPVKGHSGSLQGARAPRLRAAAYDVRRHEPLVRRLNGLGAEIATHGIDAWQDPARGSTERQTISAVCGEESTGVRMHWLYFARESAQALSEGRFEYDSTLGYNGAVGFRSGTTQVFCLPDAKHVLELPLNIMDTALFYPTRMNLSEVRALEVCKELIETLKTHGGVLTLNWHTRSLSPERNWDAFYTELLDLLKREDPWFTTAGTAVAWYRRRRRLQFHRAGRSPGGVIVSPGPGPDEAGPALLRSVHRSTVRPSD